MEMERDGWLARFLGPQPFDASIDALAALSEAMGKLAAVAEEGGRQAERFGAQLRHMVNESRAKLPRHERGEFDQRMNAGECAFDILADIEQRHRVH
jgi:hypothetical protein